jgi:5-methylcytosine-specific restriction endonuclease McrA
MSEVMAEELLCAKCGQTRPVAAFDQRFIGKGTRLTCASCRGVADEGRKWQGAWAQRREAEARQREAERALAQRNAEREHARQEAVRDYERRREALAALGFDEQEQDEIMRAADVLREAGRPWADIRRDFLALDPPYIGPDPKRLAIRTAAFRRELYERQAGRCAYCGRALLPLGSSLSSRDPELRQPQRHNTSSADPADGGRYRRTYGRRLSPDIADLPELEHRCPNSRGGAGTAENLSYACRECNQVKGVRTVEEFLAYPHDPITQLGIDPVLVLWMIGLEDVYPWGGADTACGLPPRVYTRIRRA